MDAGTRKAIEKMLEKLEVRIVTYDGDNSEEIKEEYNYEHDTIIMLPKEQYVSEEHYYAILFHELGHWTGHCNRLDREYINLSEKGTKLQIAYEELLAEIFSYSLCYVFDVRLPVEYSGTRVVDICEDLESSWNIFGAIDSAYRESRELIDYIVKKTGGKIWSSLTKV